jgi:uncharacterized hydrophobic protein (TIGR00271 family)
VIGAMIIAPLGVPIMGIALGIVRGDGGLVARSGAFVAGGVVLVVGIGLVASAMLPRTTDLLTNPQVAGRTSPTLVDMIAALATGLAGAVGMSRRDVSDVRPGVAIAISLVPPLGVVGVCAGQGEWEMALGAFVLFASNMVAMVLAGTLTFTAYGYATEVATDGGPVGGLRRRRAYTAIAAGLVLVMIRLAGELGRHHPDRPLDAARLEGSAGMCRPGSRSDCYRRDRRISNSGDQHHLVRVVLDATHTHGAKG